MSSLEPSLSIPPTLKVEADRERAVLITHLVAFSTGVPARDIAAHGRVAEPAVAARHLAMYLAHTGLGWPLARVGAAFGRDRTTVGHACRRVEDRRDDAEFDRTLEVLEACLRHAPCDPRALA